MRYGGRAVLSRFKHICVNAMLNMTNCVINTGGATNDIQKQCINWSLDKPHAKTRM